MARLLGLNRVVLVAAASVARRLARMAPALSLLAAVCALVCVPQPLSALPQFARR